MVALRLRIVEILFDVSMGNGAISDVTLALAQHRSRDVDFVAKGSFEYTINPLFPYEVIILSLYRH